MLLNQAKRNTFKHAAFLFLWLIAEASTVQLGPSSGEDPNQKTVTLISFTLKSLYSGVGWSSLISKVLIPDWQKVLVPVRTSRL